MLIPLKLYRCSDHGLKMYILFGYNPRVIFCQFFHKMKLVILTAKVNHVDTRYLVYASTSTVLC